MPIREIAAVQPGITLYHGTGIYIAAVIRKEGLKPQHNAWEDKYNKPGQKPQGKLAIFTTPKFSDAKAFAIEKAGGDEFRGEAVVFAFTLIKSDKWESEQFYPNEVLVLNPISPKRLKIVWPRTKINWKLFE